MTSTEVNSIFARSGTISVLSNISIASSKTLTLLGTGLTSLGGALTVTGLATLNLGATITGGTTSVTTLTASTATGSTSAITGAGQFVGGIGAGGNSWFGGTLTVVGLTTAAAITASGLGTFNLGLAVNGALTNLNAGVTVVGTSTLALTNISGVTTLSSATASSSISTGALVLSSTGGIGVGGNAWIGGTLNAAGIVSFTNTTNAGNLTGSVVMSGGLFVTKALNIGDSGASVVYESEINSPFVFSSDGLLTTGLRNDGNMVKVGSGGSINLAVQGGTRASASFVYFNTGGIGIGGSATIITDAASVRIGGAPIALAPVTFTNSWSLYVDSGKVFFGGGLTVTGANTSVTTLTASSATGSTSAITGAGQFVGGIGAGGNSWFGGSLTVVGTAVLATTTISGTTTNSNTTPIPTTSSTPSGAIASAGGLAFTGTNASTSALQNALMFNASGTGVPTATTGRTVGTRLIVHPTWSSGTLCDFAIGMASATAMFYGTSATTDTHAFYNGTALTMSMSNTATSFGSANIVSITNTTASTAVGTGCLILGGGLSVAGAQWISGRLTLPSSGNGTGIIMNTNSQIYSDGAAGASTLVLSSFGGHGITIDGTNQGKVSLDNATAITSGGSASAANGCLVLSGALALNGSGALTNSIIFNTALNADPGGSGARSNGTRLCLWPGTTWDYAIGIGSSKMWFTVDTSATFNFYSAGTQLAQISTSNLTVNTGTASSSTGTGALVLAGSGGLGVGGNAWIGGTANVAGALTNPTVLNATFDMLIYEDQTQATSTLTLASVATFVTGGPSVGYIQLTNGSTNVNGYATVQKDPGNCWTCQFQYLYDSNGADSLCVFCQQTTALTGAGTNNGGYMIMFDEYSGVNKIYLFGPSHVNTGSSGVQFVTQSTYLIGDNSTYNDITITYDNGLIRLWCNGVLVPLTFATYQATPTTPGTYMGFSGNSGGATNSRRIRNIRWHRGVGRFEPSFPTAGTFIAPTGSSFFGSQAATAFSRTKFYQPVAFVADGTTNTLVSLIQDGMISQFGQSGHIGSFSVGNGVNTGSLHYFSSNGTSVTGSIATTIANMASVRINGIATAGANMTFTNNWSLYIDAGNIFMGTGTTQHTGFVGIGTAPTYPLHITSTTSNSLAGTYGFLSTSGAGTTSGMSSTAVGLYVAARIFCGAEVDVGSDARMKTNIKALDADVSHSRLLALRPSDYSFIDRQNSNGDNASVGFIGQELITTVPEAVSLIKNVVPDIMKPCLYIDAHTVEIDTDVDLVGKTVRFLVYDNKQETAVEAVVTARKGAVYTVDTAFKSEHVFAYGTEVPDFHKVNYSAIIPILVAGYQKQEARLKALERRIERRFL